MLSILTTLSVIACGTVLFLFFTTFFTVNAIEIVGSDSIPHGVDALRGANIVFLKETDVAGEIQRRNLDIAAIVVEKKPLATIRLIITMRKPIAQIRLNDASYIVDDNGIVFLSRRMTHNLPVIEGVFSTVSVPSTLDKLYAKTILGLLTSFTQEGKRIQMVTVVNKEEIRFYDGEMLVTVAAGQNPVLLSTSLQMLMRSFTIEGKHPASIDLRFDKPIVRF